MRSGGGKIAHSNESKLARRTGCSSDVHHSFVGFLVTTDARIPAPWAIARLKALLDNVQGFHA